MKTGKEDFVYSQIKNILGYKNYQDYELLIPKRKLKERHQGKFIEVVKKMFPGYILIKTNEPWNIYNKTRQLGDLYRFLIQDYTIQEIRFDEIANIVYMVDQDGIIGISNIHIEHDRVKVMDGPLCRYMGLVKKVDSHKQRVKVLFKFNGINHSIDLSVNIIRRPEEAEYKSELLFTSSKDFNH